MNNGNRSPFRYARLRGVKVREGYIIRRTVRRIKRDKYPVEGSLIRKKGIRRLGRGSTPHYIRLAPSVFQ